jgi:hypothetical protein
MGKHATAGREFDESLRRLGQALMVAAETTPPGDPGKSAFHHPSSGKDWEAPLGRLRLGLGLDQFLIASGSAFDARFECPTPKAASPNQPVVPRNDYLPKGAVFWGRDQRVAQVTGFSPTKSESSAAVTLTSKRLPISYRPERAVCVPRFSFPHHSPSPPHGQRSF